jgi:adenylate cyclase
MSIQNKGTIFVLYQRLRMKGKPNSAPIEIERKFLVIPEEWEQVKKSVPVKITQAYIHTSESVTVRVRISGKKAFLTLKGKTTGISRSEFEYPIPLVEAEEMIRKFCDKIIQKNRFRFKIDQHVWEVDVFEGRLEGLIIAEIELNDEGEHFSKPNWIGKEVSHDPNYYNAVLIKQC